MALRHQLATDLALHIGPGLVNTAMRARVHTSNLSLAARHLNLVRQHRAAFDTMERENPVLLPALTAWLLHDKNNADSPVCPMRFPRCGAMCWRPACRPGLAVPGAIWHPATVAIANQPCVLEGAASQPEHTERRPLAGAATRSFLRLLRHRRAAGRPNTAAQGMPGWFWQMACNEASACKGDTRAYLELFDRIPHWAWLVRDFGLEPDNNQRRKGIAWLREVARTLEQFPPEDDAPVLGLGCWQQTGMKYLAFKSCRCCRPMRCSGKPSPCTTAPTATSPGADRNQTCCSACATLALGGLLRLCAWKGAAPHGG